MSEWAPRCPHCAASLEDASLADASLADASLEASSLKAREAAPTTAPPPERTRRPVALIVAACLALVAITLGIAVSRPRGVRGSVRDRLLFFADYGRIEVVRADGTMVKSFPQLPRIDDAVPPLETAGNAVVFLDNDQAFVAGPGPDWPVVAVGQANDLIPATGGQVGLELNTGSNDYDPSPSDLDYLAADGSIPPPGTKATTVPAGEVALARLPDGVLVQSSDGRLGFLLPPPQLDLGPATNVIGVSDVTVAWTGGSNCQALVPGCPLHLTDTARGTDRVIIPPPGFAGFVGGGGYSVAGDWLAAFVFTGTTDSPAVRLVLIDTRTDRDQLIGPVLPAGAPAGQASWSPDGKWLFFCGLSGPIYAQQFATPIGHHNGTAATGGPIGKPSALPLKASFAFAAL